MEAFNHWLLGYGMREEDIRRPVLFRDTGWLAGADIFTIAGGLIGQILLTKALFRSEYGLFVLLIDAFAVMFLLVDAGLPTIITRDVPKARHQASSIVHQTFKLQGILATFFVPIGMLVAIQLWPDAPLILLFACAGITIFHVFTYAPRSVLRALGEARQEAVVKVLERVITTTGYALLLSINSNNPSHYALAFLFGVIISMLYAMYQGSKHCRIAAGEKGQGNILLSDKKFLISALPFAVTLGIIPLIGRFEKFLLAYYENTESVAIFHVAFLAYLAGLTLPQAMRASLLPIMGELRGDWGKIKIEISKARNLAFRLLFFGIIFGIAAVYFLMKYAFPDYFSESYPLFLGLLIGWVFTMIAVPNYVAVQAGKNPWRFTIMLFGGVGIAIITGIIGIPLLGIWGAVISSVAGAIALLLLSIALTDNTQSIILEEE